jgi:hypothetical protein
LELQDLRQRFSSLSQSYDGQAAEMANLKEILHEQAGINDQNLEDNDPRLSVSIARDLSELRTTVHRYVDGHDERLVHFL